VVKPHLETAGREILVQPGNEGRCRIEQARGGVLQAVEEEQ